MNITSTVQLRSPKKKGISFNMDEHANTIQSNINMPTYNADTKIDDDDDTVLDKNIVWQDSLYQHMYHLSNINLPDTLIYDSGVPIAWYFTAKDGKIKRKHSKRLVPETLVNTFKINHKLLKKNSITKNLNIIATFLPSKNHQSKIGSLHGIANIQFLSIQQFEIFAYQHVRHRSGILQLFIPPQTKTMRMIKVNWVQDGLVAIRRISRHAAIDDRVLLDSRLGTFLSTNGSYLDKLVSDGAFTTYLNKLCITIANNIMKYDNERKVKRLILYCTQDYGKNMNKVYILCGVYATSRSCYRNSAVIECKRTEELRFKQKQEQEKKRMKAYKKEIQLRKQWDLNGTPLLRVKEERKEEERLAKVAIHTFGHVSRSMSINRDFVHCLMCKTTLVEKNKRYSLLLERFLEYKILLLLKNNNKNNKNNQNNNMLPSIDQIIYILKSIFINISNNELICKLKPPQYAFLTKTIVICEGCAEETEKYYTLELHTNLRTLLAQTRTQLKIEEDNKNNNKNDNDDNKKLTFKRWKRKKDKLKKDKHIILDKKRTLEWWEKRMLQNEEEKKKNDDDDDDDEIVNQVE